MPYSDAWKTTNLFRVAQYVRQFQGMFWLQTNPRLREPDTSQSKPCAIRFLCYVNFLLESAELGVYDFPNWTARCP